MPLTSEFTAGIVDRTGGYFAEFVVWQSVISIPACPTIKHMINTPSIFFCGRGLSGEPALRLGVIISLVDCSPLLSTAGELPVREERARLLRRIHHQPLLALIQRCLKERREDRPNASDIITELDP